MIGLFLILIFKLWHSNYSVLMPKTCLIVNKLFLNFWIKNYLSLVGFNREKIWNQNQTELWDITRFLSLLSLAAVYSLFKVSETVDLLPPRCEIMSGQLVFHLFVVNCCRDDACAVSAVGVCACVFVRELWVTGATVLALSSSELSAGAWCPF